MGMPCKDPQAAARPGVGVSIESERAPTHTPARKLKFSSTWAHHCVSLFLLFLFLEGRSENVGSSLKRGERSLCLDFPLPKRSSKVQDFPQKPQSLYTHQFVTWANSAIRSSLLSCKIKISRGHTGTKGVYPLNSSTVKLDHSCLLQSFTPPNP